MKVFNSKSLLLSMLLISVVSFSISAQEARKQYTENYSVNKGATLITDTKYSGLELLTWDKNEVDILVEVEVKASSQDRAEAALKKIEAIIEKSGNNVSLELELDDGWSRRVDVEINITIKAPAWINLDMESSYGDLFIQENSGLVILDLKYANLKCGGLSRGNTKPYSVLELAYSDITIDKAGWLELEVAYSDVEIGQSDMLFLENKYSKFSGERAGGIVAEGAYDKYYFDEVDSFVGELKYSGIKFQKLNKNLNVSSSYTPVKIFQLARDFEEVEASLSYGNFYVELEPGTAFKFDGKARYGNVNIKDAAGLSRVVENNEVHVWGNVGSNPKATMEVVTKYGNSEIR